MAVLIISYEGIKPAAELVLLLDDIVCDGTASIVLGFVPPQRDRFVVKVNNLGFAWLARRFWENNTFSKMAKGMNVLVRCACLL